MAAFTTVEEAVRDHVRAGDSLHVVVGHSRWSAAVREVVRQWWDRDPQFELVMLSLSSLGALFFRGGLVRKVTTGYSGDTFPNFTPNPWFQRAYTAGAVEVEHWSFLAFAQRLEAAARDLPAIATRSIAGSSMEQNAGFATVASPFGGGEVGLLAPLQADVAIMHAPVADRAGNVAIDGIVGAAREAGLAATKLIVTVEQVVDELPPAMNNIVIPQFTVTAVSHVPGGAWPSYAHGHYARDNDFYIRWDRIARDRAQFTAWIDRHVRGTRDHREFLASLREAA